MPGLLGGYGGWALRLTADPPRLALRNPDVTDLDAGRVAARQRVIDAMLMPDLGAPERPQVLRIEQADGVERRLLRWRLPSGISEALLLVPQGATGPLPAVLALHDHGGHKAFGWRKIASLAPGIDPLVAPHFDRFYSGRPFANALAAQGFAVLVPDAFLFGSRRVLACDLPADILEDEAPEDLTSAAGIAAYNRMAAAHEPIAAKALLCAGMTLAGVVAAEDRMALDQLLRLPEVDPDRVGVMGLSGGGLRSVLLSGIAPELKAVVCAGMMTTWHDFMLNRAFRHTWMCYLPGLPRDLDFPDILALAAPNPTLVLNNSQDRLFTVPEMERAAAMLTATYAKAGCPERHRTSFHPGPHKLDLPMQEEAFAWLSHWLQ